jgi:hypothetical protein
VQKHLWRSSISVGVLVLISTVGLPVANAQNFKPGDKVEYKAQSFPEKWETGTIVRDVPGYRQVIIRQAPSQFFPDGFERAYALNDVRLAGSAPAPAANPPQQAQIAPERPPVTPQVGRPPKAQQPLGTEPRSGYQ